jgi:hypothetical protein
MDARRRAAATTKPGKFMRASARGAGETIETTVLQYTEERAIMEL